MPTNAEAFLGIRQLPSCSHEPRVVLETVGFKACLDCSFRYMESLVSLVDIFYIRDGTINAKAISYGIQRSEKALQIQAETPDPSGDRKSY